MAVYLVSTATTMRELRNEIVADLNRRAQMLTDSIPKQTTKATKAACFVAAQALMVAATDYKDMEVK
jgi:hypothetical protein